MVARVSRGSHLILKLTKLYGQARAHSCVLLEDRPASDAGVDFFMSDLIEMRTSDLVGVLSSMGQAVGKRRPTRLELLGGVVTLLGDMGRLRL